MSSVRPAYFGWATVSLIVYPPHPVINTQFYVHPPKSPIAPRPTPPAQRPRPRPGNPNPQHLRPAPQVKPPAQASANNPLPLRGRVRVGVNPMLRAIPPPAPAAPAFRILRAAAATSMAIAPRQPAARAYRTNRHRYNPRPSRKFPATPLPPRCGHHPATMPTVGQQPVGYPAAAPQFAPGFHPGYKSFREAAEQTQHS